MNYFAHGCGLVDQPYCLVGTLLPDWLRVIDRSLRVKRKQALPFLTDPDRALADLAAGIVRHHEDDDRFHRGRVFQQLLWELTVQIRNQLDQDSGHRPHFLAHLLIELLLDAALIESEPARLAQYYAAVAEVDARQLALHLQRMRRYPFPDLKPWLDRFCGERFLYDYLDDGKLLYRVNRVLVRVTLPPVPSSFVSMVPQLRVRIRLQRERLVNFQ